MISKIKQIFFTKEEKQKINQKNQKYEEKAECINKIIDLILENSKLKPTCHNFTKSVIFETFDAHTLEFKFSNNAFGNQPRYELIHAAHLIEKNGRKTILEEPHSFRYYCGYINVFTSGVNAELVYKIHGLNKKTMIKIVGFLEVVYAQVESSLSSKDRDKFNKYLEKLKRG